jgi:hypothetical protein
MIRAGRLIPLILSVFLAFTELHAQPASYFDAGVLNVRLKKESQYESQYIPGFSLAVSGLEFSYYSGRFMHKSFPDSIPVSTNGGFYHFGYTYRSLPKEGRRRFHLLLGAGMGSYGINEMHGFQLSAHPGIQIDLTRRLSLTATCYAGYNFFGKDVDTTYSWNNSSYRATQKWFFLPSFTLRFNTNPAEVKGDYYESTGYWGGGMVTTTTTEHHETYDVEHTYSYYMPAGEYVTNFLQTTTNYVNLYPKITSGYRRNTRGPSFAYGGGVAIRAGLFALDLEYMRGKIGFHDNGSFSGDRTWQWDMQRTSAGIGLNIINFFHPFEGPSMIRMIFGWRIGGMKLDSNLPPVNSGTPNPEDHSGFFRTSYLCLEFGTLGIQLENYHNKDRTYQSGLLISATYLFPLTH